jgi:hypothetical protein
MKPEKNFMIDDILNVLTDLLKFRDYLNLSSNNKKNQKLWKRIENTQEKINEIDTVKYNEIMDTYMNDDD